MQLFLLEVVNRGLKIQFSGDFFGQLIEGSCSTDILKKKDLEQETFKCFLGCFEACSSRNFQFQLSQEPVKIRF